MWFRVDDTLWAHPKVITLTMHRSGLRALGLWTIAGSYCAQRMTDGAIDVAALMRVGGFGRKRDLERVAAQLVEAGLWTRTARGWLFVDWEQYNLTRADAEERRAAARDKKRRQRGTPEPKKAPITCPLPAQPAPERAANGDNPARERAEPPPEPLSKAGLSTGDTSRAPARFPNPNPNPIELTIGYADGEHPAKHPGHVGISPLIEHAEILASGWFEIDIIRRSFERWHRLSGSVIKLNSMTDRTRLDRLVGDLTDLARGISERERRPVSLAEATHRAILGFGARRTRDGEGHPFPFFANKPGQYHPAYLRLFSRLKARQLEEASDQELHDMPVGDPDAARRILDHLQGTG